MKTTSTTAWLAVAHLLLPASGVLFGEEKLSFERDIRPIFKAYCLDCHGGTDKAKGKLDLRLKRFAVRGGSTGTALVPGQPEKSYLLERMRSGEMPPGEKKVPAAQIAVVERWIAGGATTLRDEPASLPPGIDITPEERAYWFYQPLKRPVVPPTGPGEPIRSAVDAFILAKLREKNLGFNPEADRLTLIRRVSLDLTGLLPAADEIRTYATDPSPNAYEKMVDRYLASPAYGERWGRHWLDAAGYADSDGDGTTDTPRPYAWKYRDWVIRALNADKPFDRFLLEQLAGDELVPQPWNNLRAEQIDLLTATGYLRMAPDGTSSGGGDLETQQVVADTLKIVGSSLLGLTVGCAQCHDHRYDPIPQADYFRLRAVFEPVLNPTNWRRPSQRLVSLYTDADRTKSAAIETEVGKLQQAYNIKEQEYLKKAFNKVLETFPADQRDKLRAAFTVPAEKRTPEQTKLVASNPKLNISPGVLYQYDEPASKELAAMQAKIAARRAEKPVEDFIAVSNEIPGQIPTTKIFHRGDYRQPTAPVNPGDLTIAAPDGHRKEIPAKEPTLSTSGRRLAFARHLASGSHPLLNRVLANRVWLHLFGRGIVDTPGDFGTLGVRPTHPELLDWLATELVADGWSLKRLHRTLLTSTTYRQSSRRDASKDAVDPANALFGRYAVRRLDAETLRDRILQTTGRLERTMHGQAVAVVEDAVGQVVIPDEHNRRSVYLQVRRSKPVAFLSLFDAPAPDLNCDRRPSSTSAPQSLLLMNSEFMRKQAEHLARRLQADKAGQIVEQVRLAWKLAYQRIPDSAEVDLARRFLERQTEHLRATRKDPEFGALTNLCQQLLASNEVLHVE